MNTIGVIVSVISLFSLLEDRFFITDLLVNFKFQFFWILIALGTLSLIKKKKYISIFFLSIGLFNFYSICPSLFSKYEFNDADLKIYFANIYSGNDNHALLIESIKKQNPDIFVLQEVTMSWKKSLESLTEIYKYQVIRPRENNFGIAIYSKFEIIEHEIFEGKAKVDSIWVKLKIANEMIHLVTSHPVPPVTPEFLDLRNNQYLEIQKYLEDLNGKKLLIGDMNTVAWSKHLKRLEDKSNMQLINSLFDTWNSSFPYGFRIRLDHALISNNLKGKLEVLNNIDSDHLPMLLSLRIKNE